MLATCDIALFTPEAAPVRDPSTELNTTVVNGATLIAMPRPSNIIAGK